MTYFLIVDSQAQELHFPQDLLLIHAPRIHPETISMVIGHPIKDLIGIKQTGNALFILIINHHFTTDQTTNSHLTPDQIINRHQTITGQYLEMA